MTNGTLDRVHSPLRRLALQLFHIAFACGALYVIALATDALPLPWWAYFIALMVGEETGNRKYREWLTRP